MSTSSGPTTFAEATANGRAAAHRVAGPHEPDRSIGSIGVGFRLGGEETGGQMAIVEHPFPPGALVPPHVHTREDEFSIVTASRAAGRDGEHALQGPGTGQGGQGDVAASRGLPALQPVLPPPTATFAGDAEAHYLDRPKFCPDCGSSFADGSAGGRVLGG